MGSTGTAARSSSTRRWPISALKTSRTRSWKPSNGRASSISSRRAPGSFIPQPMRVGRTHAHEGVKVRAATSPTTTGTSTPWPRSWNRRRELGSSTPSNSTSEDRFKWRTGAFRTATITTNATSRSTPPIPSGCRRATPLASGCSSPAMGCGTTSRYSLNTGFAVAPPSTRSTATSSDTASCGGCCASPDSPVTGCLPRSVSATR